MRVAKVRLATSVHELRHHKLWAVRGEVESIEDQHVRPFDIDLEKLDMTHVLLSDEVIESCHRDVDLLSMAVIERRQ